MRYRVDVADGRHWEPAASKDSFIEALADIDKRELARVVRVSDELVVARRQEEYRWRLISYGGIALA